MTFGGWPATLWPTTLAMVSSRFALFEGWALGTLHPRELPALNLPSVRES